MGCRPDRHHHRERPEADRQDGHPEADDGPVDPERQRDKGPDRAEGAEGRESHGDQAGQQRAQEDGAQGADEAVADGHPRVGAQGAQHVELVGVEPDPPPDHLTGNEERGQAGDATEDAQGDGLGLERPLGPRQDVGAPGCR